MIVCGCCLPSGKHWCLSPTERERGGAVRPMCRACRLLPLLQQTAVAQYSQGLCSHKGHGTQSRERHLCLHGLRPCTALMSARWWYCSWLSMVDEFLLGNCRGSSLPSLRCVVQPCECAQKSWRMWSITFTRTVFIH